MSDQNLLCIKKCKVYFIYSFIVTYDGLLPDAKQYEELFLPHETESHRKGLSSYIVLNLTSGDEMGPVINGNIDGHKVKITPLMRYFANGVSLTLELSVDGGDNYLSDQFVYELQHLTSIEKNGTAKKIIELDSKVTSGKNRYYNFKKNIDKIQLKLKHKEESKLKLPITIFEVARNILDSKQMEWSKDKNIHGEIEILCQKYLKSDVDVDERQTPWVVTAIEIDSVSDAGKDFFTEYKGTHDEKYNQKIRAMQKYEQVIAPILYRAPDKVIGWASEPTYNMLGNNMTNHLNNLYLLSNLFVQTSRRSILLISEYNVNGPINYILPTVLNISEMTHTRWQNLIIMNFILDKTINDLTIRKEAPIKKYSKLVEVIGNASRSLENPLIFNVSGNVLREISEELNYTYKLKELAEFIIQKINLISTINTYSNKRNLYMNFD